MKFTLKSKTVWLNIAALASAVFALPELIALLGENAAQYVIIVQSLINLVLRWGGSVPLTLKMAGTGDGTAKP